MERQNVLLTLEEFRKAGNKTNKKGVQNLE